MGWLAAGNASSGRHRLLGAGLATKRPSTSRNILHSLREYSWRWRGARPRQPDES